MSVASPGDIQPIDADVFSARLAVLRCGLHFAVAVSGGRDSMALARLAAAYAKQEGAEASALIVDHGLREGSATEARQARDWCEQAGLSTRVLNWEGKKPSSGLQAAARAARYRLLAEAAEAEGIPAILTAHSADDQAETVLMRLGRGAGAAGLSAMSDAVMIAAGPGAPVRLLRPLLPFSRAQLTATAARFGQTYIDDPSNEDHRFERVRVRAFLKKLSDQNGKELMLALSQFMREAAARQRTSENNAFRRLRGVFTRWGGASLDVAENADDVPGGLAARLVRAVGGGEYTPATSDTAVAVKNAFETGTATLGGALIRRSGGRLWFLREPAALTGRAGVAPLAPQNIPAGEKTLWDRRFIIAAGVEDITVRTLGADGATTLGLAARLIEGSREAVSALPGLYRGDRLIGAPGVLFRDHGGAHALSLARERYVAEIVRFS